MKSMSLTFFSIVLTGLLAVPTYGQNDPFGDADAAGAAGEAPLVTRFYDVSPLVSPPQHMPFTGGLPGGGTVGYGGQYGGFSGGSGGLGGGGGGYGSMNPAGGGQPGGSGGGGFFSVNDSSQVLQQFGGGGGSGGPAGLGGGGLGSGFVSVPTGLTADAITEYIWQFVEPDSWENNGLGLGAIQTVDDGQGGICTTILIRQTEAIHDQVKAFLADLTRNVVGTDLFVLEAWWIPCTADAIRQLAELTSEADGNASETAAEVSILQQQAGGFHAEMQCRERVTGHTASGHHRRYLTGSIPIVGASSVGQQTVSQYVHLGLQLEAMITNVPDYLPGNDKQQEIDIQLRTAIVSDSSPDSTQRAATDAGLDGAGMGPIPTASPQLDRINIGVHAMESSLRVPVGKVVVVGSMSSLGSGATDVTEQKEIAVVLFIRRR